MIAVVAHPDRPLRRELARLLEQAGWSVHQVDGGDAALAACRNAGADVLIADPRLRLVHAIRRDPELFRVPVVLLLDEDTDAPVLEQGAHDVLRTPLHPAETVARALAAARTKALVEELTAQNDRLESLLFFDELTELRNRRAVLHDLERLVAGAQRHGHPLSVLMIDVDWFKAVNDAHGHRVGDQVLRQVARRLRGRLRAADVPGRLGGDELLVLLPDTDGPGATIVAESIRAAVHARPVRTPVGPIEVTVSVGSAEYQGGDAVRLLEDADRALYRAKADGRDRCVSA